MIEKHPLPANFIPELAKSYEIFVTRIHIQIQYLGPIPEVGQPLRAENFLYAVYNYGREVESGSLRWDSRNGPLTTEEAAKTIAVHWASQFAKS